VYVYIVLIDTASCNLNLGIIIDGSGWISSSQFHLIAEFIKMLTDLLICGFQNTRVSLISYRPYSSGVRFYFKFSDSENYYKTILHEFLDQLNPLLGKFLIFSSFCYVIPLKRRCMDALMTF